MENRDLNEIVDKDQEQKPKSNSSKRRGKDEFTKITDKIILEKGLKPKDFDKQAILKERKKIYDEFVAENIDLLFLKEK
ncbi:hypothetical protein HYH68_16375 [Clostridium botulinum]|uniref:hypothetical protein n=1 Tax=Clostridium botulinum TaxID=1491 RepID=UPI001C9B7506|nr:hypothetical protein [Clostridium botulinum]MBY6889369.1 hypothetical protein [Clostridium botulinum]